MISPARRLLVENNPLYYPFGKTRVQNVLKDFNNRLQDKDDKTITSVHWLLYIKAFIINLRFKWEYFRFFSWNPGT